MDVTDDGLQVSYMQGKVLPCNVLTVFVLSSENVLNTVEIRITGSKRLWGKVVVFKL